MACWTLSALTLLSTAPRSRTMNAQSNSHAELAEGGLRHETSERSTSVMMLNYVQFDGHVVSRVRVLWLGRGQDGHHLVHVNAQCLSHRGLAILAPHTRIYAYAWLGGSRERRQLCGPDSGISSQLYVTHARSSFL